MKRWPTWVECIVVNEGMPRLVGSTLDVWGGVLKALLHNRQQAINQATVVQALKNTRTTHLSFILLKTLATLALVCNLLTPKFR